MLILTESPIHAGSNPLGRRTSFEHKVKPFAADHNKHLDEDRDLLYPGLLDSGIPDPSPTVKEPAMEQALDSWLYKLMKPLPETPPPQQTPHDHPARGSSNAHRVKNTNDRKRRQQDTRPSHNQQPDLTHPAMIDVRHQQETRPSYKERSDLIHPALRDTRYQQTRRSSADESHRSPRKVRFEQPAEDQSPQAGTQCKRRPTLSRQRSSSTGDLPILRHIQTHPSVVLHRSDIDSRSAQKDHSRKESLADIIRDFRRGSKSTAREFNPPPRAKTDPVEACAYVPEQDVSHLYLGEQTNPYETHETHEVPLFYDPGHAGIPGGMRFI